MAMTANNTCPLSIKNIQIWFLVLVKCHLLKFCRNNLLASQIFGTFSSLPTLHEYGVKLPNFTLCERRKRTTYFLVIIKIFIEAQFRRRASKKDLIKLKKKLHTIHEDVKKLKYVIAIKIYKILTQIQLNYKFKKITFKNILIHGLSDCLAKGVKILNGMKCSRLFAQFLLTLRSLKFSLVLVL